MQLLNANKVSVTEAAGMITNQDEHIYLFFCSQRRALF